MNIDSLSRGYSVYSQQNDNSKKSNEKNENKINQESTKKIEDKLEISAESKKIGNIKAKISNGFYDSPDLIKNLAVKLDNQLAKIKTDN